MKVKMESPSACRRVLRVEVDGSEVDAEHDKVVQEYARAASVPGFRKGKAPPQLIRQRFAKDISDEACNRLVPKNYRDALKSQDLSPVAVIEVSNVVMKKGEPLTFSITVDVPPQFKLPKYKGIALTGRKLEVTEEQIGKAIEGLRSRAATFETVSGSPVEPGHLVQVDYNGTCGGTPISGMLPKIGQFANGRDSWILAGESGLIPGLCEGVVGALSGETRNVSVTFPPDFRVDALKGKQAEYVVTVKEVRRRVLPPVDAAFLKQLGVESEEKLHEEIRGGMLRQMEEVEKARRKSEIAKELLARTPMEVPESLVDEENRRIIQEIVSDHTSRGISPEEIVKKGDEIRNTAGKSSKENIKLDYILDAIAMEEKVEVEDGEVEKAVEALAARYRTDKEKIRHDLEKRGVTERIRRSIRVEKTLDLVLAQARINIA